MVSATAAGKSAIVLFAALCFSCGQQAPVVLHAQTDSQQERVVMDRQADGLEHLYLGGGCFWCIEAVYDLLPGVTSAISGYAGGTVPNPSYESVSSGMTGHAEVVEIRYDPKTLQLEKVLELFWKAHDPTTLNRQGYDVGTQYRSIILYDDPALLPRIQASLAKAQVAWDKPVVTQVQLLDRFWPAEDYHQDYYTKNPFAGYCQAVISPKLRKLDLEVTTPRP